MAFLATYGILKDPNEHSTKTQLAEERRIMRERAVAEKEAKEWIKD